MGTEWLRSLVVGRAGGGCKYCRLSEVATGVTFHVDHVIPKAQGGLTILANLALSCPGCNLAKRDRTTAPDGKGVNQSLFNPRAYDPWLLGWYLHFDLDRLTGLIVPRSSVGEATVLALQVNDPRRVFARQLQIRAGLIS